MVFQWTFVLCQYVHTRTHTHTYRGQWVNYFPGRTETHGGDLDEAGRDRFGVVGLVTLAIYHSGLHSSVLLAEMARWIQWMYNRHTHTRTVHTHTHTHIHTHVLSKHWLTYSVHALIKAHEQPQTIMSRRMGKKYTITSKSKGILMYTTVYPLDRNHDRDEQPFKTNNSD